MKILSDWFKKQKNKFVIEEAWTDSWSDEPMMKLATSRYWLSPPCNPEFIAINDPKGIIIRTTE